MSEKQQIPGELLASYPEHVLDCRYDDEENPSEITIFDGTGETMPTTEWITAEIGSAVALEESR
jgi:hypothetical protein